MESLKQIRERLGITQIECANKTKIAAYTLCNYENGQAIPSIEDIIALERAFNERLDWSKNEAIPEKAKENILSCINILAEHYPVLSILRFVDRGIRDGQKFNEPDKLILHFTKVSQSNYEPLYPDDVITG